MAKRRTSLADDLVDMVALLPWWACIALAFSSYVILHRMAALPQGTLQPGQMGDFLQRSMITAFAFAGQFIAPILCLIAALISFLRQRKRKALVTGVVQSNSADALNAMSWRRFEVLVGEAFRLQGYQVVEQGGAQPDGGIDLVLRKGSETHLVRCTQPSRRTTAAPRQPLPCRPSIATCQGAMVRRTAKKGASAGSQFWGCSRYPACRGTR